MNDLSQDDALIRGSRQALRITLPRCHVWRAIGVEERMIQLKWILLFSQRASPFYRGFFPHGNSLRIRFIVINVSIVAGTSLPQETRCTNKDASKAVVIHRSHMLRFFLNLKNGSNGPLIMLVLIGVGCDEDPGRLHSSLQSFPINSFNRYKLPRPSCL